MFLTARQGRTTLTGLRSLDQRGVIGVIDFPRLVIHTSFCASAVIICDIERMSPSYEARIAAVVRNWTAKEQAPIILNAPPKLLRRYELLKKLYFLGVNRKDVHRLDDPYTIEKTAFPCFIRIEAGHHLTPDKPKLLHSRDELAAELVRLREIGEPVYGKILVEYEDTRDDTGLHCKMSYHKIADTIIPAHMFWDHHWFVKYPPRDLLSSRPELATRERQFIETSPHEAEIAGLFEIAGIEYGRIDYGLRADGGIHVFEVNTNPNHPHSAGIDPERKDYINPIQRRILAAVEGLAARGSRNRLQWPRDELIYRLKCQL